MRANALASVPFQIVKGETPVDTSDEYKDALGILPDPYRLLWLIEAGLCFGATYVYRVVFVTPPTASQAGASGAGRHADPRPPGTRRPGPINRTNPDRRRCTTTGGGQRVGRNRRARRARRPDADCPGYSGSISSTSSYYHKEDQALGGPGQHLSPRSRRTSWHGAFPSAASPPAHRGVEQQLPAFRSQPQHRWAELRRVQALSLIHISEPTRPY